MRAIGRGFVVLDFGVGRTLWLVGGLYFAKTPPGGQAVDPPAQILASPFQKRRSVLRNRGRVIIRL